MKKQKGMSLVGFILLLSLLVFVAFIGMKIVPIYIDHFAVVSAMKGIQAEPGIDRRPPQEIRELLFRRLYVNYSGAVKPEDVRITRHGGLTLQVAYEVRKPVMGNLDVVVAFDKSVALTRG